MQDTTSNTVHSFLLTRWGEQEYSICKQAVIAIEEQNHVKECQIVESKDSLLDGYQAKRGAFSLVVELT